MHRWRARSSNAAGCSMDEEKVELVQAWLTKAGDDLEAARRLGAEPRPLFEPALYHCQQAVEKAVKGFLVFHDTRFTKTHDLGLLVQLATPHAEDFASWAPVASELTPLATLYRYPGEGAPSREDWEGAVTKAANILGFVLSKLPSGVHLMD